MLYKNAPDSPNSTRWCFCMLNKEPRSMSPSPPIPNYVAKEKSAILLIKAKWLWCNSKSTALTNPTSYYSQITWTWWSEVWEALALRASLSNKCLKLPRETLTKWPNKWPNLTKLSYIDYLVIITLCILTKIWPLWEDSNARSSMVFAFMEFPVKSLLKISVKVTKIK